MPSALASRDDKVTYYYVPKMIKFYLGEEPILPNVETYLSADDTDRKFILENWESSRGEGRKRERGYGMLIGPHATTGADRRICAAILADPRGYICPARRALSRSPSHCDVGTAEGRHIDLRPHHSLRRENEHYSGRSHPRGPAQGLARRQFQPGRRQQGTTWSSTKRTSHSPRLRPRSNSMLSRVADSCFWLSR